MCDGLASVDGALERLEDVLPADDHHRVDATREQRRDRIALEAVALVLEAMNLDEVRPELGAGAQALQCLRDLLAGADQHVGKLDGLLHRRLDAVEAELRGGLLGVVDDVVEGGGQRVSVRGAERRSHAAAAGQPVDDVVRDAIAFLLAGLEIAGEGRALRIVDEQVAQQQARALHVAAGLLDERHHCGVGGTPEQAHSRESIELQMAPSAPRCGPRCRSPRRGPG